MVGIEPTTSLDLGALSALTLSYIECRPDSRNRTCDTVVRSHTLCPLSYAGWSIRPSGTSSTPASHARRTGWCAGASRSRGSGSWHRARFDPLALRSWSGCSFKSSRKMGWSTGLEPALPDPRSGALATGRQPTRGAKDSNPRSTVLETGWHSHRCTPMTWYLYTRPRSSRRCVEKTGFAPAQAEANGVTDRPRSLPSGASRCGVFNEVP